MGKTEEVRPSERSLQKDIGCRARRKRGSTRPDTKGEGQTGNYVTAYKGQKVFYLIKRTTITEVTVTPEPEEVI